MITLMHTITLDFDKSRAKMFVFKNMFRDTFE